jgi:molybdopterin converting factor small subunit
VNPGQHSIHETDRMLRARLDQYDHLGYAPQLKQSVGRLMLMDAIPRAREEGLDRLRIGYVDLMLEGMSDEFLVVIDALEAVEGYDDKVRALARRMLAHTHVLEAAHSDKVALFATIDEEIQQQASHLDLPEGVTVDDLRKGIDQMSDAERAQLVEEVRHEWPPRIIVPDGLSRVRPDMNEVRARLEALMM